MKRVCLALLASLVLATPSYADVTIKMSVTGSGMGQKGKSSGTTYIKGSKMRSEILIGDRTQVTIFDLDAQKMFVFDTRKKEADVWDMAEFSKVVLASVDAEQMKASIKPNGQTKQFGSLTGNGYDMEISVPAAMGGSKDMMMTINLTGPVWIVKNAPGTADYNNFYKAAVEKGLDLRRSPRRQGATWPGESDGRNVSPVCRARRARLRKQHSDQDGCERRRYEWNHERHACPDGQPLIADGGRRRANRRARGRPVCAARGL